MWGADKTVADIANQTGFTGPTLHRWITDGRRRDQEAPGPGRGTPAVLEEDKRIVEAARD